MGTDETSDQTPTVPPVSRENPVNTGLVAGLVVVVLVLLVASCVIMAIILSKRHHKTKKANLREGISNNLYFNQSVKGTTYVKFCDLKIEHA